VNNMSMARESRMNDYRLRAQVSGTLERSDGAVLRWWRSGRGEPLVLVHGSFDDHNVWTPVLPMLTRHADVITYDRRGHSLSSCPRGRVGVRLDAEDLLALIDTVTAGPVHLVGHGYGASVAMLAATMRRESVRSLVVFEPPLFELLQDDPIAKVLFAEYSVWLGHAAGLIRSGDFASGARVYAEKIGYGKGSWHNLFDRERRATMISNAAVWLDQHGDPTAYGVDVATLSWARFPVTQLVGEHSQQLHQMVAEELEKRLPFLRTVRLAGAGHAAHLTHPNDYAGAIVGHLRV
jgi:pimeloyl-ACP methyl ester carboxylesterase